MLLPNIWMNANLDTHTEIGIRDLSPCLTNLKEQRNIKVTTSSISPHQLRTQACRSGKPQYPLSQPNAAKKEFAWLFNALVEWTRKLSFSTCGQPQLRSMPLAWPATSSAHPAKWWTWKCRFQHRGSKIHRLAHLISSKLNYCWTIWGVGGKLSQTGLQGNFMTR